MTGRVEGKVALVTGAARGQGRSHALTLARSGADIIAVDIAAQIDTVAYPLSTPDDLAETVKQIEELDRRVIGVRADVRSQAQLDAAVSRGLAEKPAFGTPTLQTMPAVEETLTMEPPPAFFMDGMTVFMPWKWACWLTTQTLKYSFSLKSTMSTIGPRTPALFTRIVTVPNSRSASWITRCHSASEVTSRLMNRALSLSSLAISSPRSSSTSVRTTFAPRRRTAARAPHPSPERRR
jgi:hypothetical protein